MEYLWNSADKNLMMEIAQTYRNCIGPLAGRPAVDATQDEYGTAMPAIPAAGDPSRYYVNVLSSLSLTLPAGCSVTDAATSESVLGVWAT